MTEYYIASEQGPLGPYNLSQLSNRSLKPTDLVWCNGMPDWAPASQVPELAPLFESTPPPFDRQYYNEVNATRPLNDNVTQPPVQYEPTEVIDIPTWRWVAIVSFLGFWPLAIVALVKSLSVSRYLNEGDIYNAQRQSRQVIIWSVISLALGNIIAAWSMLSTSETGFESYFNGI